MIEQVPPFAKAIADGVNSLTCVTLVLATMTTAAPLRALAQVAVVRADDMARVDVTAPLGAELLEAATGEEAEDAHRGLRERVARFGEVPDELCLGGEDTRDERAVEWSISACPSAVCDPKRAA